MITGRRIPIAGTKVASQPLRCGPRSTPGVTRRARNRVAHVAVAARAEDQIESVDGDGAANADSPVSSGWHTLLPATPAGLTLSLALPLMLGGSDGGSGGKGILGGDGDGDGAGSGHRWQEVATLAEDDDDDEEEEEDDDEEGDDLDDEDGIEEDEGDSEVSDPSVEEVDDDDDDDEEDPILKDKQGDFYVHSIRMEGLAVGEGIPTEHDISSMLITQPGFWGTKADLSKDLRQLTSLGLFKDVKANVKALKGGKMKGKFCVVFTFSENKWPKIKSFKLTGSKLLPADIVQGTKVMEMLPKDRPYTDLVTFAAIKKVVEGWYQRNGYAFNYITSYDGLETGNVVAKVMEPVVNKVELQFVDDNMQPIQGQKHEVNKDIVMRELPFKKGRCYNTADGRRALRDVFALNYFDNAQVLPEQNRKDPTKVDVTVMLKERPMKTVDFEAEWPVAAHQGKVWLPMPAALVPGGNMTYENRNLQKKGNTLSISINSSNLLRPADDLTFRAQYRRPYILGQNDEKKTALVVDAFNTRKISPVFSSNDSKDVPPIYIDRSGARIGLQETLSRNSKAYYGLVLQDVQAKDETGMLMPVGCKLGAGDQLVADGPPTTTSDSGVDRTLHLQAGLARDTTYWVKGTTVGARDLLAIDQGIGLGSLFNKVEASATRFIQLKKESSQGGSPPPVLVLSGSAGTAVGTLPAYEAFVLGGPHSSRGYPLGGLGAARSFAGLSAEVRQTIPVLKKQGYLFAETVADLGSSKLVRGNPTEYFRRAGRGSSYGAGVRFGPARLEYARDCNLGNGGLFVRFGERY